jgi:hypothetical protein
MSHTTHSLGSTCIVLELPQSGSPSQNFLHRISRRLLMAAITLFLCFSAPGVVKADWVIHAMDIGDPDDDFTRIEHLHDTETGKNITIFFWKDGSLPDIFFHGNPDPQGGSGPKADLSSRIDLAKQHGGGNWVSEREFWDSELGRYLGSKGKGPGPVINPADDDVSGGPGDPSRGKEKLGEALLINKTGPIGSGKGGGFHFNAGSPGEQLKKPGGPGGPGGPSGGDSDDGDDKGSSGPPPGTNYGPAELVDPLGPPIAKRTTKETAKLKTVKIAKSIGDPHKRLGKAGKGDQSLGGPDTKSLGGPDTKKFLGGPDTRIALGGPDTKLVTGAGRISSMGGGSAFRMVSPRVGSLGAGAGSFRVR